VNETSRLVHRNRAYGWARKLYGKAASTTGGKIYVYSPPVGKSKGRVIPLDTGPKQHGLPEARDRLVKLEGEE